MFWHMVHVYALPTLLQWPGPRPGARRLNCHGRLGAWDPDDAKFDSDRRRKCWVILEIERRKVELWKLSFSSLAQPASESASLIWFRLLHSESTLERPWKATPPVLLAPFFKTLLIRLKISLIEATWSRRAKSESQALELMALDATVMSSLKWNTQRLSSAKTHCQRVLWD